MSSEETEKQSLRLTKELCNDIFGQIDHFVIGGWATTAYCGNVRFTADVDIMARPLTTMPVIKAFDEDWTTKKVFYGVQAEHKKLGIQVHINTISYMLDRTTNTKIPVLNDLFEKINKAKVRGHYCPDTIEIPISPFNYLLTLKAIPNRAKDDFDFILLLLNKNYSTEEFKRLLSRCSNTKPFLDKCKRILNKDYFYSLPQKLITYERFDLMKYNAMSRKIDEIKRALSNAPH
ncbi:hypothetical protein HZC30_08000 [Candidatus Woesearchaeota archaeon]|nr:hypothetical protein [Candidatus Woesearchaeota archaeon]